MYFKKDVTFKRFLQSSSLDEEEVIRLHSWAIVNIKREYTGYFKIPHPHLLTFEYQKFGVYLSLHSKVKIPPPSPPPIEWSLISKDFIKEE